MSPFLKNYYMPKKFLIIIPILFVPLATVGGKPKKIKVGSVISEPPAETRLINPTKTPNNNNVIKINNVTLKHTILFLLRFIIKLSKNKNNSKNCLKALIEGKYNNINFIIKEE